MIVLDVKISNLACFKDFHINFVTEKKFYKNSFVEPALLPNSRKIYYKNINVIMGANASGKTIFGELLMQLQILLSGGATRFLTDPTDEAKPAKFEIIFSIGKNIFQYTLNSKIKNKQVNVTEIIKLHKLTENQTWNQILKKLDESQPYPITTTKDINDLFLSSLMYQKIVVSKEISENEYYKYFRYYIRFIYRIKTIMDKEGPLELSDYTIKLLDKLLKIIDSNIVGVSRISTDDLYSFYVKLRHNKKVLMRGINKISDGLEGGISLGTIEAIHLIYTLSVIKGIPGIIYIDEQMAYMHTNLSNAIIYQLIDKMKMNSQLFITTHNENVLDLRLPLSSFMFFKKEENNITVINPEKLEKPTVKNLKFNVQSNYYGTYQENIDEIWDLEDEE